MFRYPADRLPVILILALTVIDFSVYFTVDSGWLLFGYLLLALPFKGIICAWNHHHQHTMTFHSTAMNRALEFCYALHTGVTTNLWKLHHVLGHHHNYLDQTKDESRWQRSDGSSMGALEYSVKVAATAYYRGYQVGKKHPKPQRAFLTYGLLTLAAVLLLVVLRPLPALFVFIVPMLLSLLFTAWVTYDHHSGLDTDDPFEASYNNTSRWFNLLTGNLGYHTAHHYKQGVHWSKLPELHAKIEAQIPEHCYRKSTFDVGFIFKPAASVG